MRTNIYKAKNLIKIGEIKGAGYKVLQATSGLKTSTNITLTTIGVVDTAQQGINWIMDR